MALLALRLTSRLAPYHSCQTPVVAKIEKEVLLFKRGFINFKEVMRSRQFLQVAPSNGGLF